MFGARTVEQPKRPLPIPHKTYGITSKAKSLSYGPTPHRVKGAPRSTTVGEIAVGGGSKYSADLDGWLPGAPSRAGTRHGTPPVEQGPRLRRGRTRGLLLALDSAEC